MVMSLTAYKKEHADPMRKEAGKKAAITTRKRRIEFERLVRNWRVLNPKYPDYHDPRWPETRKNWFDYLRYKWAHGDLHALDLLNTAWAPRPKEYKGKKI